MSRRKAVEPFLKASAGLFVLAFGALLLLGAWLTERPQEPQPESGLVVPFNVHGTTYYISESDDDLFGFAQIAVAVSLGLVVATMVVRGISRS